MYISFREIKKGIYLLLKKKTNRPYKQFNISWVKEKILKHSKPGKNYIHTYQGKYRVHFNSPISFMHTVRELFIDEIYAFTSTNPTPLIIDCGAYIGTSILYFKTNYPQSRIIAFEPDTENYNILKKNIEGWNFDNVNIQNCAVWDKNEEMIFEQKGGMAGRLINESGTSSRLKKIETKRLKDFLNEKVDLLKIDIEGAEYEVLLDCSDMLGNVDKIFIEFHADFNELHKLNEILNILTKNNFRYYIKEAGEIFKQPLYETKRPEGYDFDVQLNLFAFK